MPGTDPTHWLLRLSPDEWLAAADTELHHCDEALRRRAVRPGVTHARRAAGMAWNAVMVLLPQEEARFGRSYMEHVAALSTDEETPAPVRAAALALREIAPAPPELITLGKPDMRALDAATAIVAHARAHVAALQAPAS